MVRVAIVLSGEVRSFEMVAFNLRRHVLQLRSEAEMHVFACVSHAGSHSDLRAIALLESFPETRAMTVESEIACLENETDHEMNISVYTKRWWYSDSGRRAGLVTHSSEMRDCRGSPKDRGRRYQFGKIGRGFALAAEHADFAAIPYDAAVRMRTDAWFAVPYDLVGIHLALRARHSAKREHGEYLAIESNEHCEGGEEYLCYGQQISDAFMLGAWNTSRRLWTNLSGIRHKEIFMAYPCCEEYLVMQLAFSVGVRQASDAEQVPTLPLARSLTSQQLQRVPWVAAKEWFHSDGLPKGSLCGDANALNRSHLPAHQQLIGEICVPPGARSNPDPWDPSKCDRPARLERCSVERHLDSCVPQWCAGGSNALTRYAKKFGHKGHQPLAPYTAPLYRLKHALWLTAKPGGYYDMVLADLPRCGDALHACRNGTGGGPSVCETAACGACGFWAVDAAGRQCVPEGQGPDQPSLWVTLN